MTRFIDDEAERAAGFIFGRWHEKPPLGAIVATFAAKGGHHFHHARMLDRASSALVNVIISMITIAWVQAFRLLGSVAS
jgi:hypothetical protein